MILGSVRKYTVCIQKAGNGSFPMYFCMYLITGQHLTTTEKTVFRTLMRQQICGIVYHMAQVVLKVIKL